MSDKTTTTITYGVSALAALLSFINQNAAAIAILVTFATFVLNWWFQIQKLKLEKAKLTKEEIERLEHGNE